MKKATAMERLLREGFFETKEAALPYLMSGAVYCGGVKVLNGGQKVDMALPMNVRGLNERYVGKGGYKLEGRACATSAFQVAGPRVHRRGRVYRRLHRLSGIKHGAAIGVCGRGGLRPAGGHPAARIPRVVNLEKTNLGDEKLLHAGSDARSGQR